MMEVEKAEVVNFIFCMEIKFIICTNICQVESQKDWLVCEAGLIFK